MYICIYMYTHIHIYTHTYIDTYLHIYLYRNKHKAESTSKNTSDLMRNNCFCYGYCATSQGSLKWGEVDPSASREMSSCNCTVCLLRDMRSLKEAHPPPLREQDGWGTRRAGSTSLSRARAKCTPCSSRAGSTWNVLPALLVKCTLEMYLLYLWNVPALLVKYLEMYLLYLWNT